MAALPQGLLSAAECGPRWLPLEFDYVEIVCSAEEKEPLKGWVASRRV